MAPKKQNPPPPKPPLVEEEEPSDQEEEEEEEEESPLQKLPEGEEVESESGEEEEEEGSETEEEEEVEETQRSIKVTPQVQSPSIKKSTPLPLPPPNSSLYEEDLESEDEQDEDKDNEESPASPTASDFTVRPITVKPISKVSKFALKRPSEARKDDAKGSKNRKKAKTGGEGDEKKGKVVPVSGSGSGISRIWSEENEVVILQGYIEYRKHNKDDAHFYEFIKGKLWESVSKNQVSEKLRRLKDKFKKAYNGEDPVYSKPHECKMYDLSKKIWGGDSISKSNGVEDNGKVKDNNVKVKKGGKAGSDGIIKEKKTRKDLLMEAVIGGMTKDDNVKKILPKDDNVKEILPKDDNEKKDLLKDDPKDDDKDFLSKFPNLSASFDADLTLLKDNLHLVGTAKAREFEEQWKKLRMEEMDVLTRRLNLIAEQSKLVLDAMKKSY